MRTVVVKPKVAKETQRKTQTTIRPISSTNVLILQRENRWTIADVAPQGGEGSPTDDQDNDGVINFIDACPDTEPGAAVDPKGCSVEQGGDETYIQDTDEDGIIDIIDVCPETPADQEVDEYGCSAAQKEEKKTLIKMVWMTSLMPVLIPHQDNK